MDRGWFINIINIGNGKFSGGFEIARINNRSRSKGYLIEDVIESEYIPEDIKSMLIFNLDLFL